MALYTDLNRDYLESDKSKVTYITTYFTGKAIDWFNSYLIDYRNNNMDNRNTETILIFSNYNYFVQKLRRMFSDINIERITEQKLLKL